MRAALLTIAADDRASTDIAGRALSLRQLDFALAGGCELVILHGNGAAEEAIALRHAAEKAGARFRVITNPRGLPALLAPSDDLLVLQSNLLPAARWAVEEFAKGARILVLPGEVARPGGFERIDLARSWAGAMLIPAGLADGLQALDEDFDAPSTLLRIALQYGVKEADLPTDLLGAGEWDAVQPQRADELSRGWLARYIPPAPAFAPARWLARKMVRVGASRLAGNEAMATGLAGLTAVLSLGGVALAGLAPGWAAFVAVGLAVISGHAAILTRRLQSAPFGNAGRMGMVLLLPDLALLACGILAIEGPWHQRLFPPLILFVALRLLPFDADREWLRVLRDRLLIALVLAIAAAVGQLERAVMLTGILALVPNLRILRGFRG